MKRTFLSLLLCALLLLPGCGGHTQADGALRVAATTYPVYLLAQAVAGGAEGVEVSLVIDQQVSCLHDYTLTMKDMEAVERADVLVLNGAGLEDFLEDVLEGRTAIDCSEGIELLESGEEHDHGHEDGHHHEEDPHIWMDPLNAARMAQNIAAGLSALAPEHGAEFEANARAVSAELEQLHTELLNELDGAEYGLVTFHDGFGYFARSFGLDLLAAVEEEEGSEASAKTIREIVALVEEYDLPAVFTEVNGSDATAQVIGRECGVGTYPLSMCMSGEGGGLAAYEAVIRQNVETILEAYS